MKKVGVTGVGFIGTYVLETLLSRGYTPVIFDHHKRDSAEYPEGCEIFLGDVRDPVAVTELVAHVDGIIHLAACLGTQETIKNPFPAIETNVLGGINVLEACAQYDVPAVNIAVGNWWFNNSYSITKNMIERFIHMYNKERKTRINIVRAVNAYGPRQLAAEPFAHGKVRKITPALICRALSGMPMELYGGGKQISDMVYVGDVAEALVRALEKANEGIVFEEAIEIGSVEHTSIRQVADMVNDLMNYKELTPVKIVSLPMRPGELVGEEVIADVKTIEKLGMDIEKLVPLRQGLDWTIDYYINTEGRAWHKP